MDFIYYPILDLSYFTCWRKEDKTQGVLDSTILSFESKINASFQSLLPKNLFAVILGELAYFSGRYILKTKNVGHQNTKTIFGNKLCNHPYPVVKLTDRNRPDISVVNLVILRSDRRFFQHFQILLRFRATDFRFISRFSMNHAA